MALGASEMAGRYIRQDRPRESPEGKALFATNCASCHNSYPYTWTEPNKYGKRFIEVGLVPKTYMGTDPGQFDDLRPYALTGQLSPYLPPPYKGKESSRPAISISSLRQDPRQGAGANSN